MRRFGQIVSLVAVGCALVGAYNVYADNSPLEDIARRLTCVGHESSCHSRLLRLRRSPFGQEFVFTTGGTEQQVDCVRPFLLFGNIQCARQARVTMGK